MRKKIFCLIFTLTIMLLCNSAYAVDDAYSFDIVYTGDIVEDQDKEATVILQATEGTVYSNVRIKVDFISGPSKPTILAYDSAGIGYNIAELGYWGPETGFAVGGTFKNETPIVATYKDPGTYVVQLTLIDLNNNNAVITSKQFTQVVLAAETDEDNNNTIGGNTIVDNNTTGEGNVIDKIPQTGTSIWGYVIVVLGIATVIYVISRFKKQE